MGNVSAHNTSIETISSDSLAVLPLSENLTSAFQSKIYVTKGTVITNSDALNAQVIIIEPEIEHNKLADAKDKSVKKTETTLKKVINTKPLKTAANLIIKTKITSQSSQQYFSTKESSKGNCIPQIPMGKIKAILSYNLYYFNRYATRVYYIKTLLYNSDSYTDVFRARPPPALS